MITIKDSLSGSYFSCTIPDVSFSIDGYRAAVVIKIDDNEIYNEYLYPVDGDISIVDIGSLVASYVKRTLRSALLKYQQISSIVLPISVLLQQSL